MNLRLASKKIGLDTRSKYLRQLVIMALDGGGRGHLGASMSLIEILRILYDDIMQYQPDNPSWENRDRFILSKGHGCLALYGILADKGFFSTTELKQFCRQQSFLGGHPERGKTPGIEASTGALGHGLSMAVGMALAAQIKQQKHRLFVVMGDGEINEGSVWEAAMSASKYQLNNLTAIVDYNKLQSYGRNDEVLPLEPLMDKWQAFGFETIEINGHDTAMLKQSLEKPLSPIKPTAIICHTVKGKGIAFAEGQLSWHHKSNMSAQEIQKIYSALEKYHA